MVNREIAPEIKIPSEVKVKMAETVKTAGGVELYTLSFNEYDVVRVSFIFRAGTKYQDKPFCSTSVAGMLSEGCEGYSAREISELLDYYGIYYDYSTDRDYTVITLCALERFFGVGIELLARMLTSPMFPKEEFDIYRFKRKSNIEMQRAKIDFIAREEFAKLLFGETHYYGRSYHESLMDELQIEDLHDYYNKYYNRENLFIVASGKLSNEHIDAISSIADKFPTGKRSLDMEEATISLKDKYVEWQGANQSVVRVGRLLFTRTHPDFVAMQVVAMILGGYFSSRLISNLREEKGYTYGVFAGVINLEDSGYFAISTEVEKSATDSAVEEIFKEIERLRVELIGEEELIIVKRVMVGEIMRVLDGPFGIADITIENILNNRDNNYLNSQLAEIMSITPERIMSVAQKYMKREDFVTLIVGDNE